MILATSILNEGFLSRPDGALLTYLENTKKLVDKVLSRGSMPVVITMYGSALYSESRMLDLIRLNREIEALGVPVMGLYEALEGRPIGVPSSLFVDGVHPNDLGHELIADSLTPLLTESFSGSEIQKRIWLQTTNGGVFGWRPLSADIPASVGLSIPNGSLSWTFATLLYPQPLVGFGSANWGAELKIVTDSEQILVQATRVASGDSLDLEVKLDGAVSTRLGSFSTSIPYGEPLKLVVRYSKFARKLEVDVASSRNSIELDGVPEIGAAKNLIFSLSGSDVALLELASHRIRLSDENVDLLDSSLLSAASLESWYRFDSDSSAVLNNLANAESTVSVFGSWMSVVNGRRCAPSR